jgi:hypothetical protein
MLNPNGKRYNARRRTKTAYKIFVGHLQGDLGVDGILILPLCLIN